MPIDTTVIARDGLNLIADMPMTLTYNAANYTGRKTLLTKELKYGEFGSTEGYNFSVRLTRADADLIPNRAVVTVGGTSYRVISRDNDRFDLFALLHLGDSYA